MKNKENNEKNEKTAISAKASASTKRSLIQSAIALLSCCLLLIGATFAWFSDTINTTTTIEAGNLDFKVSAKLLGRDDDYKEVNNDTDLFEPDFKWEPGAAQVVQLKLENAGSLSLQYKVTERIIAELTKPGVNVDGDELDLTKYICFNIIEGDGEADLTTELKSPEINEDQTAAGMTREDVTREFFVQTGLSMGGDETTATLWYRNNEYKDNEPNTMLAGSKPHYITLVAYMPKDIGNEANYMTSDEPDNPTKYMPTVGLGIDFKATQVNVEAETDSFGSNYDKDAESEVLNDMDPELSNPGWGAGSDGDFGDE